MKKIASNMFLRKATAIYMVVVISFANFPLTALADGLSVDLVVNGQNSLTLDNSSQTFTYSWSSQNATACEFTSPGAENVSVSGSSLTIASGDQFYPAAGNSVTFSITCFDSVGASVSDSVTVSFEPTPPQTPTPTVDLVVNGSNGPLTITNGDIFTYTWSSQNATACAFTSPASENVSVSGSSSSIAPGNLFYPAVNSSKTFTIECSNSTGSATDSVVVNVIGTTTPPTDHPAVTVDIVANGSDGPLNINSTDSFIYTWSSQNATACEFTSPGAENVSTSGSSLSIAQGNVYFPTASSSKTFTITCTNGTSSATDSVVVNLNVVTPPTGCTVIMPTGTVNFANATLVVPEGACPIMVSFSSYTFATTIVPYDKQILVDNITDTYGPGTYHIGPLELRCNWQTDLYVGPVQEHLLAVGGHDQSKGPVLGYNYMENQICDQGNIVVTKVVINDNGRSKQVSDFPLLVGSTSVTSGATTTLTVGTYKVSETYSSSEYSQSFSGDCDSSGNITLTSNTTKTCVITNNDTSSGGGGSSSGGSSRHRSRSRGIVQGINAEEPTPVVLGAVYNPGLPNTGSGTTTQGDFLMIMAGLVGFMALNIGAAYLPSRKARKNL